MANNRPVIKLTPNRATLRRMTIGPDQRPEAAARLLNRELGMLAFNERVLFQAEDGTRPLLERLRFVTIVSGNLDEFF